MSRHHKKKRENTSRRKNRRKQSYTSEEETEETEDSSQTTTSDESSPRDKKKTNSRSKSRDKIRRNSTDDDTSPRERKNNRNKTSAKRERSSDKKRKNSDDKKSINLNRMVAIASPSIDQYDMVSTTTETSELPPQPPRNKVKEKKCEKDEKKREKDRKPIERKTSKRSSTRSPSRSKSKNKTKPKKSPRSKHVKPTATPPSCLCSKSYDCPILLPCGHTFCKNCVTIFVETSDGKLFNCPVCLSKVSLQGEDEELFCPNFIILKQIENEKDVDDYVCSACDDENEADYFCENCSDLLCEDCVDAHRVVKYTKEHIIKKINSSTDMSKLNQKRYFCVKHDGEILDTFCTKCEQSVCRQCVLRHHHGNNHTCIPMQNAVKLCHDEIRRKSFNFKGHTPNLHLALMDIKRIKKALREQVSSVRTEVSESIKRLIANLKEKEKELYQNVDQVYKSKINRLNAKKEKIVIELEKYEAINRVINQLERHDNNVELLQMKATIKNSMDMLGKGQSTLKVDKETFLLKSNEQVIRKEINKHGELFRIDESSDIDGKPSRQNKGSSKNKLDNAVLISDFEDNASTDSVDGKQNRLAKIILSSNNLSKARKLRAKGNWLIVRSRVKDIIKYGVLRGIVVRKPKKRMQSDVYSNRIRRSKAKTLKAKANWLVVKSHIPDVAKSKPPPKIAKPRITPFDVTNIWSDRLRKGNKRKAMRVKAVKQRANANWLLVRSRIRDIVDYGRVIGRITFNVMQVLNSSKFRRNRESRTILKLKHFRALHLRAHANWLLVASRLKDIVEYPKKKERDKKQNKKTWSDVRKDLVSNRNKASRNKQIAGSIRAHANWLIVKTRFPDIILYGKYRDFVNKNEKDKARKDASPKKKRSDGDGHTLPKKKKNDGKKRSRSTSPPKDRQKARVNWDTLLLSTPPKGKSKITDDNALRNWDKITKQQPSKVDAHGKKSCNDDQYSKRAYDDGPYSRRAFDEMEKKRKKKLYAFENWNELIKGKIRKTDAVEDWNELIKGNIRKTSNTLKNKTPSLSKKKSKSTESLESTFRSKQKPFNDWNALMGDGNQRNETTRASDGALNNWDELVKNTPSFNKRKSKSTSSLDTIVKQNPMRDWDNISKTSDESNTEKQSHDALKHWDKLIKHDNSHPRKRSKIPLANWEKLVSSTPTMNKSKPDKAVKARDISTKSKPDREMQHRDKIAEKCWDVLIAGVKVEQKKNKRRARDKWHDVQVSLGKADNKDSFDEVDSNWNRLIDTPEKQQEETQQKHQEPVRQKQQEGSDNNITNAFRNWHNLVLRTDETENMKAFKNWDTLVTSTEASSDESPQVQQRSNRLISHSDNVTKDSYNHWSNLLKGTDVDDNEAIENWHRLLSDRDDEEAMQNWNKLIKSGKSKAEKAAYKHWDKLIEGRIIRTKPKPQENTLEKNWDVLVATPQPVKSPAPSKTSQSSGKSSVFNNWYKLTTKTPPLPKREGSNNNIQDDAYKNWYSLINDSAGSKDELAFDNWNALLSGNNSFEPFNGSQPHGVEKLYEKPTPKPRDSSNKVLSLNIRNSKGEFHNVNLKLSSPDKSILSAHVAENTDGTFTIFCCPRIDNDFNMFVSLSGEQFKHEIKVVNFYGSFAGIRKNEVDLACRTISLLRWHLTPGLLTKKGDKVVARKGSIK